MEINIF